MAKTTAPLLSFGAAGQIAKTAVFATWRGRPYVRRHVIPANPQSVEQTKTRSLFAWLSGVWKSLGPLGREPWGAFATGQAFLDRNAFIGQNTKFMRGDTNIQNMVFSPGARGGLPATSFTPTGGVGQISCAFVLPTPPDGWTLNGVLAVAITDQDPQTESNYASYEGEDPTPPYDTVVLTVPAGDYVVGGFPVWNKPNGQLAYGPGITATATAT